MLSHCYHVNNLYKTQRSGDAEEMDCSKTLTYLCKQDVITLQVFKTDCGLKRIEKLDLFDATTFVMVFSTNKMNKLVDLFYSLRCVCFPVKSKRKSDDKTKHKIRERKLCLKCCPYKFFPLMLTTSENNSYSDISNTFNNLSSDSRTANSFCEDVITLYKLHHVDLTEFEYIVKLAFQLGHMRLILHILSLKVYDNKSLKDLTCLAAINGNEEVYSYMTATEIADDHNGELAKAIILSDNYNFVSNFVKTLPYQGILAEVVPYVDIRIVYHLMKLGADVSHNDYQAVSEAVRNHCVPALVYFVKISKLNVNHRSISDSLRIVISSWIYRLRQSEHDRMLEFLFRENFAFEFIPNLKEFLLSLRTSRSVIRSDIIARIFTKHKWSVFELDMFNDLTLFVKDQVSDKLHSSTYIFDIIDGVQNSIRKLTQADVDSLFPHVVSHLHVIEYLYKIKPFDKQRISVYIAETYFSAVTCASLRFIIKKYGADIINETLAKNLLTKMKDATKVLIKTNTITLEQLRTAANMTMTPDDTNFESDLSDSESDRHSASESDFESDLDFP
jgi:hypothetical protein